jgi:hypothetical protein
VATYEEKRRSEKWSSHRHERREGTYDEVALELAPRARHGGVGLKVVDVVVEDDVDATGSEVLLDPLAVFVWVSRVEELRVRVDDGNLLARERVLDLARVF